MKKRNIGLDLLKILSMFMILFMHFTSRETLQADYNASEVNALIVKLIDCFCCAAVNCYFLITGYFLVDKKLKLNKILSIWRTVLFYTITIFILNLVIFGQKLTMQNVAKSFFPIITEHYWFITAYIAILFLAPILNLLLKNITQKQYQYLLLILTIILVVIENIWPRTQVFNNATGISFATVLYIYLIGGYIKLYKDKVKVRKEKYILGYIIFSIFAFIYSIIIKIVLMKSNVDVLYSLKDLSYNSVWVVLSSIMLFMYFKEVKIKNTVMQKVITSIQPLTLSVYIIHENIFLSSMTLKASQYQKSWMYVFYILVGLVVIYISCCIIEYIRVKLSKLIFKGKITGKIEQKLEEKIDNFLREPEQTKAKEELKI